MTKKHAPVAITIPRSFAALAKCAGDDPEQMAYLHTAAEEASR
jgi:hypothetical protein